MTLNDCYRKVMMEIRGKNIPAFVEIPMLDWLAVRDELGKKLAAEGRVVLSADMDRMNFLLGTIPVVPEKPHA